MEEQATTTASAMSNISPLESSSTAIDVEHDDDDFGTFSGFETAASSDMKSDDDGSPDEYLQETPEAASPPLSAMVSSSLNEDEFFDAPFEAANINQLNDLSNENVENEVLAEMNQPEVDIFSSTEHAAIIPPNDLAAVESKGGEINDNNVADSTDLFGAFDGIAEGGGGEQNEAPHFNQQDDIGFGEFEGTVSGSLNDVTDISPSNGDDDDTPNDASEPAAAELVNGDSTSPEYDENSTPANHYTEKTNTTSLESDVSAFESQASPGVEEIADPGHTTSDITPTPADTLSAFDAFAEIQNAPLPPFGGASHATEVEGHALAFADAATGTTIIGNSGDNFGEFAGVIQKTQNYTTEEGDDTKERETTIEEEVAAPVSESSVLEVIPTNVLAAAAAEEDSVDVFGAFEETSPASDAFGALSSPAHEDMGTAHAEQEQDTPVQDGIALVTEATEKGAAFDEAATEENDDFGDFSASNEKDLPAEVDTAFTEVDTALVETAVEENDDFGDFTAPENNAEIDAAPVEGAVQESDFDDFGGFASPPVSEGKELVEEDLPVEEDVDAAEVDTHLPEVEIEEVEDIEQNIPVQDKAALAEANEKAFDEAATEENDDFGDFTASNEKDLPAELDTAFTEVDTALVETAVEENDFGDFTAPENNSKMDTAHVERDNPKEEDIDRSDATEKERTFDETATGEVDDFGDFTAPSEEDLPVEIDTAFTEVGTAQVETAVEESDDFGDFTAPENNAEIDAANDEGAIEESDFDDFGGFASPPVSDGAVVAGDLPVEEDVGLSEQDMHLPEVENEDNGDFGDFTAHVSEAPPEELHSALPENNVASTEIVAEGFGDFGDFSAPAEVETHAETAPVASVEEVASPNETTANEDDEFGDFGGFSSPAIETVAATNASEGASDDDFGNFGDFSAPAEAEAETDNSKEERPAESHNPADAPPSAEEEDDFGEFGDFAAFEEEAAPTDNEQNTRVEEKATEEDTPQQVQTSQAVSAEEDEFEDFGDFEESDEVKETSVENESNRPVHVLNENVRDMFQKVFRVDNPAESDSGDGCVQLPFDVPMRTVLTPRKPNAEEKGDKKIYKSDKEIKDITEYIKSLPTSPPSIILSEEKWYPYTQYVFHRDGTPYIEKANLMGVSAPSVPEVLSIELPTGFDASTFSPNNSSSSNARCTTPPEQPVRPTATLVDFPSADTKITSPSADTKSTEEGVKEAAEDDEFDKLSATGKKFMDKMPDLSYMLQPTLSTAN